MALFVWPTANSSYAAAYRLHYIDAAFLIIREHNGITTRQIYSLFAYADICDNAKIVGLDLEPREYVFILSAGDMRQHSYLWKLCEQRSGCD